MIEFTVDTIIYSDLKIVQPKKGFRFSVDSPLLYRFVRWRKDIKKVLDIGSGSGVLSVLLTKKFDDIKIDAVEKDDVMYDALCRTVKINKLNDKIQTHHCDILVFKPESRYDLVICNPPYREVGSGRLCKNERENLARFESTLSVDKLFHYVKGVLKTKGIFYLCYDADLCANLFFYGRLNKLEPKRIRYLHKDEKSAAKLVFMEFIKDGKPEIKIEPPLFQNSKEFDYLLKG